MDNHRHTLLASGFLALAALACNAGSSAGRATAEIEMTLDEALEVTPEDRRPEVLELMGVPDAFTLQWQDLEGKIVRWEEWSYFDAASRFDFVDGELAWTIELDPPADGALYAHAYNPLDFHPAMTPDDARALLADQTLDEQPLDEADIPGGLVLAGDQILLGFDGGRLVYVQTFALNPNDEPVTAAGVTATTAPTATLATATPAGPLLVDDFDGESPAQPLFGAEFMTFAVDAGEGALTALTPGGVLPVMYAEPSVGDFTLEVDIRFPDAAPGSAAGIVFRSDDIPGGLAHYYYVTLRPADSLLTFDEWQNGAWAPITSATIGSGSLDRNGVNQLRLEAHGNIFRVYVNGDLVIHTVDTSLPQPGIVGLSLVAAQSPQTVYFDNLRLEALSE